MAFVRGTAARVLVAMALMAGTAALGAWWSSMLLARSAGSLSAEVRNAAVSEVEHELQQAAPQVAGSPQASSAVQQALRDPAVTQALAGSPSQGSAALRRDLAQLDPALSSLVGGNLSLDVGSHGLASLAHRLRGAAGAALAASLALAAAALAVSPTRARTLRRLGVSVAAVSAAAVLFSWLAPVVVGHVVHGTARTIVTTVLHGGDPVRGTLVALLAVGTALVGAGLAVEVLGGRRHVPVTTTALAPGRVA